MFLQTFETYNSFNERELKNKNVVVIDTLRATSVITTALYNGAKEIIPVSEVEEAMELVKNLDKTAYLLGGERNSMKIEGFDLSNSPLEYTREKVENKTIIFTTTNGTKALKKVSLADNVILGCLLNASAIAKYIHNNNKDTIIVCSGTEGKFSFDDIITAGVIYKKLQDLMDFKSDDLSKASYFLYKPYEDNLYEIMKHGYHLKRLEELGYKEDIEFCLTVDKFDIVPKLKDGVIRNSADL
ncbi:2-phosphosulfolactate phosphatase [Thermoanaerobacter italicus Ab9]|uniref:Probable 2-phosphosulfolactate phosphatase n=1 Tax=Thermoanaerobacter italicus (strain DSM 9252 / Ab9) TaxID=580331 RepID=D3T464_THEIA|nr:2-phosphosulfolactate phosphatase family protein [Thermoanaerobacter italicus]ADD03016.1 2-phosphosulfolactate phosphatase [Thermoanaerobacter italicus Ab9]